MAYQSAKSKADAYKAELARQKRDADSAKVRAETARVAALSEEASKFASTEWEQAEHTMSSGVSSYSSGDYAGAKNRFDSAENYYAKAELFAKKAKERKPYEPEMVLIRGGTFRMGSPPSESGHDGDEEPVRDVTVGDVYMGKYEVTFAQYDVFCDATSREKPRDNGWGRANRPAINVSWNDGTAYCEWLSKQTGRAYRLPTEAEWEYACRADSTTKHSFGDSESSLDGYAWYFGNSDDKTHEVGTKKPNAWGLYDMHGNVWEWCADWHISGYYRSSPRKDPQGPSAGSVRVLRGGSWSGTPDNLRSANRYGKTPYITHSLYGFRLCRGGSAR